MTTMFTGTHCDATDGRLPSSVTYRPAVLDLALVLALGLSAQLFAGQNANRPASASPATAIARAVSGTTSVKSLVLQGTVASGTDGRTGQLTTTVEPFEMKVLLPNHYIRVENRVGFRRVEGFNDNTLIKVFRPLAPDAPLPSVSVDATAELARQRVLAARWVVGILGSLDGALPLAAKPSSTPSTLRVTGPEGFDCSVDLSEGGVPLRLRFEAVAPFYTPPGPGERQFGRKMERAEWTWAFANRKVVDGVQIPHAISIAARSLESDLTTRLEEFTVRSAVINAALTPADFQVK
jgi:hypothetical protein